MFFVFLGRKGGEDGFLYVGVDVNCGNILLIFFEELVKDGLLEEIDFLLFVLFGKVDFDVVVRIKDFFIVKVVRNFVSSRGVMWEEFDRFRMDFRIFFWFEEVVFFVVIDNVIDVKYWWDWLEDL